MGTLFGTFFEIGTAIGLSIFIFLILPSVFLFRKLTK